MNKNRVNKMIVYQVKLNIWKNSNKKDSLMVH